MSWLKDYVILILLIGTLFGATLGNYPLSAPDGARYAEIPREMLVTGNYVTPHLNGVKYFEKPPLFYWLQAISLKQFGNNELGANLVNALMGLLSCLLVYFVGRKLFGRTSGFLASIILATTTLFFAMSRLVTLDMSLAFLISSSLFSFLLATQEPLGIKRDCYLWSVYLFAALAVMTKGLIGIVFPVTIIFLHTLIFNEWRNVKTYRIFSGLILFFIITLPWHLLVQIKNPEFFHFYFIEQHFLRYLTPYAGRQQAWWFFPGVLLLGFFPWTTFLPQTILYNFPRSWSARSQFKAAIFLLLWAIFIFIFYLFSNSKLIPYLLPIFPPLAILTGSYLAVILNREKTRAISCSFYFALVLILLGGIAAFFATFALDFTAQIITKNNLYLIAASCVFSAVCSFIVYRNNSFKNGIIALIVTFALVLQSLAPVLPIANKQSIKPLALFIKAQASPNDEIMSYDFYYQDLPFYLERQITVVNYKGELEFGTKHQNTHEWMIDQKTFWQRWQSKQKIFMLTSKQNYENLKKVAPNKFKLLATGPDDVVVTN